MNAPDSPPGDVAETYARGEAACPAFAAPCVWPVRHTLPQPSFFQRRGWKKLWWLTFLVLIGQLGIIGATIYYAFIQGDPEVLLVAAPSAAALPFFFLVMKHGPASHIEVSPAGLTWVTGRAARAFSFDAYTIQFAQKAAEETGSGTPSSEEFRDIRIWPKDISLAPAAWRVQTIPCRDALTAKEFEALKRDVERAQKAGRAVAPSEDRF